MSEKLQEFLSKLGHPLSDIKKRSASTLQKKLEVGLCKIDDLLSDPTFLSNVISLLQNESLDLKLCGIELLHYILQDYRGATNFESVGGRLLLNELKLCVPAHLEEKICSLLEKLDHPSVNHLSSLNLNERSKGAKRKEFIASDDSLINIDIESGNLSHKLFLDTEDSCISEKDVSLKLQSPILFSSFPWVPLTDVDLQVLNSLSESLINVPELDYFSTLEIYQSTLFKDFPIEVFLQRPFIIKVLLQHLNQSISVNADDNWRIQEKVCDTLCSFTQILINRLKNPDLKTTCKENETGSYDDTNTHSDEFYNQRSRCCAFTRVEGSNGLHGSRNLDSSDSSVETIHDSDDSENYDALKQQQLTVIDWCCHALKSACALLNCNRSRVIRSLLCLIPMTMRVLRGCISPHALWQIISGDPEHYVITDLGKISSSLLQSLNILSTFLIKAYKFSKHPSTEGDIESKWLKIKSLTKILILWSDLFSPPLMDIEIVFKNPEIEAFKLLLSDPCFYIEQPENFTKILCIMRRLDNKIAVEVEALDEASLILSTTKSLFQVSSSEFDEFLEKAADCVPLLFVHKSHTLVEKIVRGLAKQASLANLTPVQSMRGRQLLLQMLSNPDQHSRVLAYTAVKNLVVKSVGISEAYNSRREASLKVFSLLHSSVFNHLIFSGCCDRSSQIVEACRTSLLSLIIGRELMSDLVLENALDCFSSCLLNLQNLVDSETSLGKAVFDLPYELSKRRKGPRMNLLVAKFYLKCLLNKCKKVREDALKSCLALLVTSSSEYISVASSLHNFDQCTSLLAINPSVEIMPSYPANPLDRSNLKKVLRLIAKPNLEKEIIDTAWTQLTFLFRNPSLHEGIEEIWPVSDAVRTFKTMLKVSGGRGHDVSQVPLALEVLFLRASFSPEVRRILSNDEDFLLLLLRASLFFHSDDRVQLEVSLIFALILNEEVIECKSSNALSLKSKSLFLPILASTSQYVAFKHSTYSWSSDFPMSSAIKTLWAMAGSSKNSVLPVSPVEFLKLVWSGLCASDYKQLLRKFDFASTFSQNFILASEEYIYLRMNLSISCAGNLMQNIENATNHRAVKQNVNLLHTLLHLIKEEKKMKSILQMECWDSSITRFLLCSPNTAPDKQILYHILNVISAILKLIYENVKENEGCLRCSMILMLKEEFSKSDSSLSRLLKETGTTEMSHLSPTSQSMQSLMLLNSLISVVSSLTQLSTIWECKCSSSSDWQSFVSNISSIFFLIIKKCKSIQDYNLSALIPTMECFIHLSQRYKLGDVSVRLTPLFIDLLMSFHVGRGRAHNTFLGSAVSVRSLICLAFCISNPEADTPVVVDIVRDEIPHLPWLLAAVEHSAPSMVAAGLKVLISLSMTQSGARVLDQSWDQVPGGVWSLCLRLFVKRDFGIPIRCSSLCVLLNLSSLVLRLPKDEKPWRSLCITDTVTGVIADGEAALIGLLRTFDFFDRIASLFKSLSSSLNDDQESLKTESGIQSLDEFVSSERSEWLSSDDIEGDDFIEPCVEEYPELLELTLQVIVNFLLIRNKDIMDLIHANDFGKLLVKQLSYLSETVKVDSKWNGTIEKGFQVLRLMGPPFSTNTQTASVAVNIFVTDYTPTLSLRKESFSLLMSMIDGGGWGAVRVLELLRSTPERIVTALVEFLHDHCYATSTGVRFVGILCKLATISGPDYYLNSLKAFLDTPLLMHGREDESCPGWEFSRHLIQLLPHKLDPTMSSHYSPQDTEERRNIKTVFESLKLLLMVSKSARDCAYFLADDLLKVLSFSLSNLNKIIRDVNIHITFNMMNKKELRHDFLLAIHALQVATNWISEPYSNNEKGSSEGFSPLSIGECLIPELHPLWIPALRAEPFLDAVVQFLVASTSHVNVCGVLTRTTVVPGALLSHSRTKNSFLVSIIANVNHLLTKQKLLPGRCVSDCRAMPRSLLEDSLDLLINCARVHESAYVIVKEGFVKNVVNYLENVKDLSSLVPQCLVQCLSMLTLHREGRSAILKVPSWIKCLKICSNEKKLTKNVLLVFINMILNTQSVKNMLSTDEFVAFITAIVRRTSYAITKGEYESDEAEIHSCLILTWAVGSNNERCKAILKRSGIKVFLDHLMDNQIHAVMCHKIINIIGM